MKKELFEEKVAKSVTQLLELHPLDFSTAKDKETTGAMRESLARMYGDIAMRTYLENAVKDANKALVASFTMEQHIFYKSRMETLMQLLVIAKNHFIHFEVKRSMKEPLRDVESKVPGTSL